jgi:hypothetical protein
MSRAELIALVGAQAQRIAGQDSQISLMAGQIADLVERNESLVEQSLQLVARLARVEYLLSRNSGNSSSPPSKDDDPGRTPPKPKQPGGGAGRKKGKQPGAAGSNLAWRDTPDDQRDRFPQGRCECGTARRIWAWSTATSSTSRPAVDTVPARSHLTHPATPTSHPAPVPAGRFTLRNYKKRLEYPVNVCRSP